MVSEDSWKAHIYSSVKRCAFESEIIPYVVQFPFFIATPCHFYAVVNGGSKCFDLCCAVLVVSSLPSFSITVICTFSNSHTSLTSNWLPLSLSLMQIEWTNR